MKQKLLPGITMLLCIGTSAFAIPPICITDSYGEQTTLTVSGKSGHTYSLTGSINYTLFGGTIWPCAGTYNTDTHILNYTATNPSPDGCIKWATTVTFTYTATSHTTASGSFSNSCGVSDGIAASGTKGNCAFTAVQLKQGEYGGSGTPKHLRSQLQLPEGMNWQEMFNSINLSVSPNPAVSFTRIMVTISESTKLNIAVYNQQGTLVNTILNANVNAGDHSYTWNLQNAAGNKVKSGYYMIKITTAEGVESRNVMVTQ